MLHGKTILVVDDEADLRNIIATELETYGGKAFEASGGHEAFAFLQKQSVDAIISDIRMPNGNGIDLLEKVRETFAPSPVIFLMTAFGDISETQAREKGAITIFKKPFSLEEMVKTVAKALEK